MSIYANHKKIIINQIHLTNNRIIKAIATATVDGRNSDMKNLRIINPPRYHKN